MIDTVRADAASDDDLDQLATAARTVSDMEEAGDATLGHFVDQCRRRGRSLTDISKALGVTKQAAHKRFTGPPNMERFTTRAVTLLERSTAEARRLGHNYVGTEHILLGMLTDAESLATRVLAEAKVTHAQVEAEILKVTAAGSPESVTGSPFTPRAAAVVQKALSEALQLGHNYIGTEHVLLALFADPESLAYRVLTELGATYDDCRQRVISWLSGFVAHTPRAPDTPST
jgi:hypothetical protein